MAIMSGLGLWLGLKEIGVWPARLFGYYVRLESQALDFSIYMYIVYGANVKKDGRRAVKRDLSASPTQDQRSSSVKRLKSEGTAEPTEGEYLHASLT